MSAETIELTEAEREDIEDEALIKAARLGGLPSRLGPRDVSPFATAAGLSTAWTADAACAGADPDLFTEPRSQAEAAEVIKTYCSGCPMVDQCLTDGRALRGWGVHGGTVLVSGRKAADHRPLAARVEPVVDPLVELQVVPESVESPEPRRGRGQRLQPCRPRSRKVRRRRGRV